jgi:hypothetical protein
MWSTRMTRWRATRISAYLFGKTFRFNGGEITNEFLMSLGYLPGTRREDCPVFARIATLDPPWRRVSARLRFRSAHAPIRIRSRPISLTNL